MWKIGGDGGTAQVFAPNIGVDGVFALAADQAHVYVAAPDGPGLIAVSIPGAQPMTIKPGNVHRIAVDDVGVYYGDHDQQQGGALWMMMK